MKNRKMIFSSYGNFKNSWRSGRGGLIIEERVGDDLNLQIAKVTADALIEKEEFYCETYKSKEEIPYDEWEELWKKFSPASFYNSPEWLLSALDTFNYKNLRVIGLREKSSGKLVGVLPLVRMRLYGLKLYSLPAFELVDHYSLLLAIRKKGIINILIKEMISLGTVYIPGFIKNDLATVAFHKYARSFITEDNPYIKIDKNYIDTIKNRRGSRTLRKAERDFEEIVFSLGLPGDRNAINDVIEIDIKSSKAQKGKSTFDDEKNFIFFKKLIEKKQENVFVSLLYFDEEPVAYNIGFVCNGVYACSQKAHLIKYNKYRPGALMFLKFIETVCQKDSVEIDIGKGMDDFKKEYTQTTRKFYSVAISRNKVVQSYIVFMYYFRKNMYELISRNKEIYNFYKNIKKLLLN